MIYLKIAFDFGGITDFGLIVAACGYLIVFLALVVMYFVYNNIYRLINMNIRKRLKREGKIKENENLDLSISGETAAVISMALYMYLEDVHDDESHIITIKSVSKRYSPWNSKIYGLNNFQK